MKSALGTTGFFVLAPGTMAGLVPWLLTGWDRPSGGFGVPDAVAVGACLLGLLAVVSCFARFVTEGHGTPAPAAPTDTLVVGGIYRHARNPMYVGVTSVIGAQAQLFRSGSTFVWMLLFFVTAWSFVRLYEEPTLGQQFGESYQRYRDAVPGWWPRLTPYRDSET